MKKMLWVIVLVVFCGSVMQAQDIVGDWQGTLHVGTGLRLILKVSKGNNGGLSAMFYSIDQGPEGMPVTSITLQGTILKFSIDSIHGNYEGKIGVDGASIEGTWTQFKPLPLDFQRATKETAWPLDPSPHTVQFITVDKDVKLEVLDWGGTGRPLILLAGLGNTAHVFDRFASKFIATHHVYGITRRGFGASSAPALANGDYSADRLGDDVLAVMAALKLDRPILVGHSIAGEELSSIGSRHPEKVAGLIYLEAGYPYAYYDRSRGDLTIDSNDLKKKLDQMTAFSTSPQELKPIVQELLETGLPQIQKDLQGRQKELDAMPDKTPSGPAPAKMPGMEIAEAIIRGEQKYTEIKCPVLAIFAVPHNLGPVMGDPAARAAAEASDLVRTTAQANAFEAGVPSAHVIRLANASHFVFLSNEADVLREMSDFLVKLP